MNNLKFYKSVFLILICFGNIYSQKLVPPFIYYNHYQEGDTAGKLPHLEVNYFDKNFRACIDGYLNIHEQKRESYMLYNLSACYALIGNIDSAFYYLEELNRTGFKNLLYLENCPDFNLMKSDIRWSKIIEECKTNLESSNKSNSLPEVKLQLLRMREFDQFTDFILFIKNSTSAYSEISEDIRLQEKKRIYTSNFDTLLILLKKYGVLGKSKVGEDGASAFWLIAQHADHDVVDQEFILNQMTKAPEGEFSNNNIAYLTDRVLKGQHKKQLYGTQSWENPETKKWELYPIQDPEKVNERRISMGLDPKR